jgi:nitrogen-specific signal transduction histidine kinase
MSFIKNTIKKLRRNDIGKLSQYHVALSQLTHDLKNNFVTIRAAAGSIKKNLSSVEANAIEKNLSSINKMLDYATLHLEMIKTVSGSVEEYPCNISSFFILNCINEAIRNYPFPSQKCLLNISLSESMTDFSVVGNRSLILHVFYCLIRNAINAIYNCENAQTTITLEKGLLGNHMHFQIPKTEQLKDNLFSLGLPDNPGYGFQFIQRVMVSMGGKVTFNIKPNDILMFTLSFVPSN